MSLKFTWDDDVHPYSSGSPLAAGAIVRLPGGRVGVSLRNFLAGEPQAVRVKGVFTGPAASADTWPRGAFLVWNDEEGRIEAQSGALDVTDGPLLGIAFSAKTDGQTEAQVMLNANAPSQGLVLGQVYEFDVQTGEDAAAHILIPSEANPHGLLLLGVFGVITEQMAGSGQDQGIVSIRHGSTVVSTLTPSDAAADEVGDVIVGTLSLVAAATGAVAPVIPAGQAVNGIVTQATAGGSPAGKYRVHVVAVPLL